MPDFRAVIGQQRLTEAQRRTLVDQAEVLIEGLYVHLPLKRAMHAVDPLQRLRLLRHHLVTMSEPAFHAELLRIFIELRDLHTNYILPAHYKGFAFLGVLIEQYEDSGDSGPRWIVSKVFDHLVGDPNLVAGAELTHWNGMPMATAVERNAEREAGSNHAARIARGLENMTLRPVRMSLPPDEDWVRLTYTVDGTQHETRIPWRVFESAQEVIGGDASASLPAGVTTTGDKLVGLDLRTELVRRAKQTLFAPAVAKERQRIGRTRTLRATAAQAVAGVIPTTRPEELLARTVDTTHGTFGHLRIFTFHMEDGDIEAFLNEVVRLLAALPQDGLILDVRGNGGGYVVAAEFLLQFFTPRRVHPEPMQFINTDATADLCHKVAGFGQWSASIDESVETAAPHSAAFPLYPEDVVNSAGQLYHGPVLLITDALCYSATDIFSAGFQDNGLGPVLGVDDNTGAGGANVLTHADLRTQWTKGPLRALPAGAEFRVALRRSLRVGDRFGQPVEDLGVLPDVRHHLTKRDLLDHNADLMEKAGELLAAGRRCTLAAEIASQTADALTLAVTTKSLTSLDVYSGLRPVLTKSVADGVSQLTIPLPASVIRIEGFAGEELAAAQRLTIG